MWRTISIETINGIIAYAKKKNFKNSQINKLMMNIKVLENTKQNAVDSKKQ